MFQTLAANTERTVSAGLRTRGAAAPRRLINPAVALVQAVANAPRRERAARGQRRVLYCTMPLSPPCCMFLPVCYKATGETKYKQTGPQLHEPVYYLSY
jgi:hypothetical protein